MTTARKKVYYGLLFEDLFLKWKMVYNDTGYSTIAMTHSLTLLRTFYKSVIFKVQVKLF